MVLDRNRASLELLLSISRELATTLDLPTVLDRVLSLSINNVGAATGSLVVLDEEQKPVTAAIFFGGSTKPYTVEQVKDIIDHGLAGWVLENKQAVLVPDTSKDERWLRRLDDLDRSIPNSAICVPMLTQDRLVGVLTMVHPRADSFGSDNLALLQAIADLAAIAIRNAHLYDLLQIAHQRYLELFEDSIDLVLITNWQGQILEANRQAVQATGFSEEELRYRTIQELHDINAERMEAIIQELQAGRQEKYESHLFRNRKGNLPVQINCRRVKLQTNEVIQWIIRDISERKDLDALRNDLAAMIYHDLRSPLSNIISSLDILESMLPMDTSPSLNSVFQITTRSAERLQRLTSSLLDINRLESGQALTNLKTVNILEIAEDAIEAVRPTFESRQQVFTNIFPKSLPMLHVDADMIRRVMINLLENGSKFTPFKGEIAMGAKSEKGIVYIWVKDNGVGIPPEWQKVIFEKFTRLHSENAPKGVGLGLAFCRLAVRAHGGEIVVESKDNNGSKFTFSLPVKQEKS